MNCSLCKYRSNLLGFEKEVGLLQESHHLHVEGLEMSCKLCDNECTGECDTGLIRKSLEQLSEQNHHHHLLYPNADHPFGPITLN